MVLMLKSVSPPQKEELTVDFTHGKPTTGLSKLGLVKTYTDLHYIGQVSKPADLDHTVGSKITRYYSPVLSDQ